FPRVPGCRRTNPAAVDSTPGTPADSLLGNTLGVQFQTGENSVLARPRGLTAVQTCGKQTLSQDDGGDLAPVIGLLAGGRAPIAEEILSQRIGARLQLVDAAQSGPHQSLLGIAGEVEVRPGRRRRPGEEAGVAGIVRQELRLELGPHLVGGLPDGRPDRSCGALAPCSQA